MDDALLWTDRRGLVMRQSFQISFHSMKTWEGGMGKKSRSLFFVQLALLMMKFTKWAWKLCNVNLQRLVLASATIEGPKNAKGKQAIKMCNRLGVLKRSRQVIWMSGVVELEEYFPGPVWFNTEDSYYSQSPALGDILTFSSRSPSPLPSPCSFFLFVSVASPKTMSSILIWAFVNQNTSRLRS